MGQGYQISVVRRPPDPTFQGGFGVQIANGQFTIPRLPAGNYMLTIRQRDPANSSSQVARAFVELRDHDVDNVDLTFSPTLEIAGAVKVTGNARVPLANLRISLEPVEPGDQAAAAPVQSDGAFTLKNVLPDLYRLRLANNLGYITSLKVGDRDLADGQLDLRRGVIGPLSLTVSGDMGRIEGLVTDEDGKPSPLINVTMIPDQDKPDWRDRFQNRLTDSQGRYVFPALMPGHYTVFAWKDVQRGAPQDPEFRKPFEKLGISLSVEPNGRQTLDLKQIDATKPPHQ